METYVGYLEKILGLLGIPFEMPQTQSIKFSLVKQVLPRMKVPWDQAVNF